MKIKNIIALALTLLLSLCYITNESRVTELLAKPESFYAKIKIFTSVLETINRVYVDKRESDELLEDAIKGVLSNLDPHTVFLPADDFKNWNQNFEGYTGIGISFEVLQEKITVISVIEGSPAAKINIQPGDKILEIGGESVIGIDREEVVKKLIGPVGIPVTIKIAGNRLRKPQEYTLTRKRITLDSVPLALQIRPGVGYVKLERFTGTTSRELEKALNNLEAKGMKSLILDLRGNSGGYLNAAVEVADKFIPGGHKILSTRGRLSSSFQEYYSTASATHQLYPLIVLIDHGAASASEIVAGAIQDLDRGLIVGKSSFGKGLVQSQYRFQDGSALLITTARYYTPSGRQIQRDYFDKSKDEYYQDAYDDEHLNSEAAKKGKPKFKTLAGRTVYGGGGIRPDIWVKNQENILSKELRELYFSDKRIFYAFADDFLIENPTLRKNLRFFINRFIVTEKTYQKFTYFVKTSAPEFSRTDFTPDKNDIKFLLKREMAFLIGGSEARFRVNLQRDKQLNESLKYLQKASELLTQAYSLN
ncbi:S41 family peptidase [candidate division KSB1 bacterium]|nr:S41 family peptidase [candidate division KSB1 bacterium]